MSANREAGGGIKSEILAAISAALACYGYSEDRGYRITRVTSSRSSNPWRKAGIVELMLGRELNRDLL